MLQAVGRGETIVIARGRKSLAKLVPYDPPDRKRPKAGGTLDVAEVAGWASLSPFHSRSAFRHTVESSVYIAESHQRQGLARALMHQLIDRAGPAGHHVILAIISADQTPSILLHQSLGFRVAGHLHEVGRKFDRWLDLVTMELRV